MRVTSKALRFGALATFVYPAVGMHGFLDSLLRGHSSQAAGHSEHNVGRTVMDALRLAMQFGSSGSPDSAVPHAEKVFDKYDLKTPFQQLSRPESDMLLKDLGFTAEEIKQMQAEMDTDGDGFVNKREFNNYISMPEPEQPEAKPVAPAPAPAYPSADSTVMEVESRPTSQPVESHSDEVQDAYATSNTNMPELATTSSIMPWVTPSDYAPSKPLVLPPIGRDEAARKLQNHAARSQDTLVDAVENAEVAEIKRSVFRSLFRLRSAQIKEYDTIARLETQAIDDYNDKHTYRNENPLKHLSDFDEPVSSDKDASFHHESEDEDDDI